LNEIPKIKHEDLQRALDAYQHEETEHCKDLMELFLTISGIGHRAEAFTKQENRAFTATLNQEQKPWNV
jgi:hypothetical protein